MKFTTFVTSTMMIVAFSSISSAADTISCKVPTSTGYMQLVLTPSRASQDVFKAKLTYTLNSSSEKKSIEFPTVYETMSSNGIVGRIFKNPNTNFRAVVYASFDTTPPSAVKKSSGMLLWNGSQYSLECLEK